MKLTKQVKIRISSELDRDITDVASKIGFEKSDLMRLLMNRALRKLKSDANSVGGYENLDFSMK